MENRLSFGIGCFHFGIKKTQPFKFKGSEYIKELRTALQSISNIDNINIYCDDIFKNWSTDLTQELPNIKRGKGFFPRPFHMFIEFEVYIPFRIQKQLLERGVKLVLPLETYTERFKVLLHYAHYFPVTFIEPVNSSQESTPSNAVKIVREFLEQEFKNSKSDYIRFEYLGPSPFHADCYIQPGETKDYNNVDWKFKVKIYPKEGYDEIVFYFNPGIFTKVEKAKRAIEKELRFQEELGFFYNIVQREVVKYNDWIEIQNFIGDLVSNHQLTGVKGFLKKLVLSKRINEAFTSIAGFEVDKIFSNYVQQRDYRDIYSEEKIETYFQSYIDNKIKRQFTHPTKQALQLISFFERRRIKSIENFMIFVTAIISAIIGGVIVALLTK